MPSISTSAETLVKIYGTYHLTRLQADKNVKELAEGFEKAQARLKEKLDAFDAASLSAMRALAVRDGEDAATDEMVRRFNNAVLSKCNNNRKSPLYLRYFPDGMFPVVSAPIENEILKVTAILSKLGEETDPELAAFAGPITAVVTALQAAVNTHAAALEAEANAFAMVQAEKINWLDTYKLDHRSLAHLYYKDGKKADTYFKPAAKDKKEAAAPAVPEVPKV